MARRGFLDYVLGGAVGGLEGLAQKRAAEEERKRMADAAARQNMLDTVSLLNAGYDPEGFSMDAPGATPRPVFDTQMVGTRKFTRSMSPGQTKHMEEVQKERAENRSKRLDASLKPAANLPLRYTEGKTGINVYNPNDKTSTNQPYAKGFSLREPASASAAPTQEELDEAIAAFSGPLGPAMRETYEALRARGGNRSDAASILAAYRELKVRAGLPVEAGGMRKPTENWMSGIMSGGMVNPAAIGTPGAPTPSAPLPAARVNPAATTPKPASTPKPAPAPIADQALEEDRRLYDAGVAKYGSARMLAEFGPRK